MRIKKIFILIFLTASHLFSQDTMYQSNSKALTYAFDGTKLGYFAVKYWFTNRLAAQATFYFYFNNTTESDNNQTIQNRNHEYRPGIGLQYVLAQVEGVAILGMLDGALGIGTFNSSYSDPNSVLTGRNEDSFNTYSLTLGIGVELWLTKRLALAGVQSITYQKLTRTSSYFVHLGGKETNIGEYFSMDNSKLVLSFYF